jgi:hypothetical protein
VVPVLPEALDLGKPYLIILESHGPKKSRRISAERTALAAPKKKHLVLQMGERDVEHVKHDKNKSSEPECGEDCRLL